MHTAELTAQRRPGERTFRRVVLEGVARSSCRRCARSVPDRRGPARAPVRAGSRSSSACARAPSGPRRRGASCRASRSRCTARDMPTSGPLADPGALGDRGAALAGRDPRHRRGARRAREAARPPAWHRVPARARRPLASPREAARARRARRRAVDVHARLPRARAPGRPGVGRGGPGAARARPSRGISSRTPPRPRRFACRRASSSKTSKGGRAACRRPSAPRRRRSPRSNIPRAPPPPTGVGAEVRRRRDRTQVRGLVAPSAAPAAVAMFASRTTDKAPPRTVDARRRRSSPATAARPSARDAEPSGRAAGDPAARARRASPRTAGGAAGLHLPHARARARASNAPRRRACTDTEGLEMAQRYLREKLTDGRVQDARGRARADAQRRLPERAARPPARGVLGRSRRRTIRRGGRCSSRRARRAARRLVDYPPEPTRVWPFARRLALRRHGPQGEGPRELLSGARSRSRGGR